MNGDFPLTLGRLVLSRAGRDKGHYFLIVGVEGEEFVLLSDGDTRKILRPKKKKIKHVRLKPSVCEDIADRFQRGAAVYDQDIRQAIFALTEDSRGE